MEEQKEEPRSWKGAVWGVFLIVLGTLFLLDRAGTIDLPSLGHLWPLVFFVIAVSHLVDRRVGSSLFFVFLGAWFFVCEANWMGLDYGNSWPLLMVGVGISIVIKALTREDERFRRRRRRGLVVDVGINDRSSRRSSRGESGAEEVRNDQ